MAEARMIRQLVVRMPSRVGLLAEVTAAIREAGVNISAICAYEMDGRGEFMMVTDDNAAAADALTGLGAEIAEEDAALVEMPDRVGALQEAAQRIADEHINIYWVYATAGGGDSATVIIKTADDQAVVDALNA